MTQTIDTPKRVRAAIHGCANVSEVRLVPEASLRDELDLDLAPGGPLAIALEEEFGLRLTADSANKLRTVDDVVRLVEATPLGGGSPVARRARGTNIQRSESVGLVKFRIALAHVLSLGIFFVPTTSELVFATLVSFFLRVFAWEGGSHRYFAHRSYRTSRAFQFFIALLAAAGGHRGPLWWASQHRLHHRHTDQSGDPHSPVMDGIYHAYVGWAYHPAHVDTDLDLIKDFARYPELVWLNRYHYAMPYALMAVTYLLGEKTALFGHTGLGLSAVIWVFFFGMVLSLHAAFVVNGFMHNQKLGFVHSKRYQTSDTATNSWFWCIPTMGASWHNNHHRYMNAARAGHYWWELDLTYLILRGLALVGIVWDLHPVPSKVLAEGRPRRKLAAGLRPDGGE